MAKYGRREVADAELALAVVRESEPGVRDFFELFVLGGGIGRVDDLGSEVAAQEFAVGLAEFGGFEVGDGEVFKVYERFLSKRKGLEVVVLEVRKGVGADLIEEGFESIAVEEVLEFEEELA